MFPVNEAAKSNTNNDDPAFNDPAFDDTYDSSDDDEDEFTLESLDFY